MFWRSLKADARYLPFLFCMRIFLSVRSSLLLKQIHAQGRSQRTGIAIIVTPHLSALTPTVKKSELLWKSSKKAGICSNSPVHTLLASNNFQFGKFPKPAGICPLSNYQLISLPNACLSPLGKIYFVIQDILKQTISQA